MKTNIEPGCLCVITAGIDQGKEITTVRYIGDFLEEKDVWEVNRGLEWLCLWESVMHPCIPVKHLMRIDGHEPETQDVKQAMDVE